MHPFIQLPAGCIGVVKTEAVLFQGISPPFLLRGLGIAAGSLGGGGGGGPFISPQHLDPCSLSEPDCRNRSHGKESLVS